MRRLSFDKAEDIIRRWSQDMLACGGVRLDVVGRDHAAPGASYVVMSNHTSLLDVPAIFLALPGPVRMIAKSDIRRIPVFGKAMDTMGHVFVDRGDRLRAVQQLEAAKDRLARGVSVWISPEGTRSRDGALGPFKKGGFHLAQQLGVPILPLWIEGASAIVAPDETKAATGGTIRVRIGASIATAGVDVDALMTTTRGALLALGGDGAKDRGMPTVDVAA